MTETKSSKSSLIKKEHFIEGVMTGFVIDIVVSGIIKPWQVLQVKKGEQGASGLCGKLDDWAVSSLQQSLSQHGMADSASI